MPTSSSPNGIKNLYDPKPVVSTSSASPAVGDLKRPFKACSDVHFHLTFLSSTV
ncbi:hypothetical protein BDZ97DRAFT_1666459 [Flammula alnicola]|nr:hypothetical protein BDZ97DRAFT_1666459 [Flammula alnicola]